MKKQEIIIRDEGMRARVIEMLSVVNLDKPKKITIQDYRKGRTLSQNALMWMWINEVADIVGGYTGYDAEEIHELFKQKFLPASARSLVVVNGHVAQRLTTTTLTTQEMSEYMNAIDRFCATELGLVLPHPQDMQRNAS